MSNRTQEEPQRCLAKWPNQTRTVHAGSELAQVIGLKLNPKMLECFMFKARSRAHASLNRKECEIQKSEEKAHQDHTTSQFSYWNQWNSQRQKLQWTKMGTSGGRNNCLYVVRWINTKMLLVDRTLTQLKKPKVIHEIIYLRTILVWRQRLCHCYGFFTTPHSIRRRRDGSNIHWHQQRQKTKPLRTCAKHIEDNKVGTEDRLVQKFETSKVFGSVKYQIHQTTVVMPCQTTKVTRTTSIVELSIIERLLMPTNVINCLRLVHQPQRNHGQTDHGLKQTGHGKLICKITARDIQKTCWDPSEDHKMAMVLAYETKSYGDTLQTSIEHAGDIHRLGTPESTPVQDIAWYGRESGGALKTSSKADLWTDMVMHALYLGGTWSALPDFNVGRPK